MEKRPLRFKATLGKRERVFFYALGCGLFLGMPLFMGIGFSLAFKTLDPLFLPVPFFVVFLLILLQRPTGYILDSTTLHVKRPVGSKKYEIGYVRETYRGPAEPLGMTVGLVRSSGIYGVAGSFWNREWGRFEVYVTDGTKTVQIIFQDGRRLFISPEDPAGFVEAFQAATGRT